MTIRTVNPMPGDKARDAAANKSTKAPRPPRAKPVPRVDARAKPRATASANGSKATAQTCIVCGEKYQAGIKVGIGIFEKEICGDCAQAGQKVVSLLGRIFG